MKKDARISAKNDKRSAYQEMIQDIKNKKINVIVAFKLDRLTRSVYQCECDIDCMTDESNTTISNGQMVNTMLFQFFFYFTFYFFAIFTHNYMKCCNIVVSIYTANMNMMNIYYALYL